MNVSIILVCSGVFLYIFGSFVIEHNTIVYDGYSYPWPVGEDAEHHQMRLDRQKIWRYVGRALSYIGTVLTALASLHWWEMPNSVYHNSVIYAIQSMPANAVAQVHIFGKDIIYEVLVANIAMYLDGILITDATLNGEGPINAMIPLHAIALVQY